MSVEIDYNFESSKQQEDSKKNKDLRKNLRIVRCCTNCKYFLTDEIEYKSTGFCKYPHIGSKSLKDKYGDYANARLYLPKTHRTLLCDNYQLRTVSRNIVYVGELIGKKILNDGTVQLEE